MLTLNISRVALQDVWFVVIPQLVRQWTWNLLEWMYIAEWQSVWRSTLNQMFVASSFPTLPFTFKGFSLLNVMFFLLNFFWGSVCE